MHIRMSGLLLERHDYAAAARLTTRDALDLCTQTQWPNNFHSDCYFRPARHADENLPQLKITCYRIRHHSGITPYGSTVYIGSVQHYYSHTFLFLLSASIFNLSSKDIKVENM